jgi:hypothetical protein
MSGEAVKKHLSAPSNATGMVSADGAEPAASHLLTSPSLLVPRPAPDLPASVLHPSGIPLGRHEGPKAFAQLVRQTIAVADAQAWREWWWCDHDFADWPLGEREVVEALDRWAGQGRKLRLLASRFQGVRERLPRFVTWRVRWDHCIEARACPRASVDDFPSGMWMPGLCWRRIDPQRSVVLCSDDARFRAQEQQQMQEWWAQSTPSFPASTLGL